MFTVVPNHKFQQVRKGPITTISEKKHKSKKLTKYEKKRIVKCTIQRKAPGLVSNHTSLLTYSTTATECIFELSEKLDGTSPSHLGSIPPILLISPLLSLEGIWVSASHISLETFL